MARDSRNFHCWRISIGSVGSKRMQNWMIYANFGNKLCVTEHTSAFQGAAWTGIHFDKSDWVCVCVCVAEDDANSHSPWAFTYCNSHFTLINNERFDELPTIHFWSIWHTHTHPLMMCYRVGNRRKEKSTTEIIYGFIDVRTKPHICFLFALFRNRILITTNITLHRHRYVWWSQRKWWNRKCRETFETRNRAIRIWVDKRRKTHKPSTPWPETAENIDHRRSHVWDYMTEWS